MNELIQIGPISPLRQRLSSETNSIAPWKMNGLPTPDKLLRAAPYPIISS